MQSIEFHDTEGNKLIGTISIPDRANLVVIMSHGFSSSKESNTYLDLEKRLNNLGIGTFRYDGYGHGELYCKDHPCGVKSDVTLTKSTRSLTAAVKYVRGAGNYKIILMGSSYGGLVSLIVASRDPDILALALKSPVIDPVELWTNRVGVEGLEKWKTDGVLRYDDLGEKFELNYEFFNDLKNFDLQELVNSLKLPILIVHGEKDTVVPIQSTKNFAQIVSLDLHIVKGANHGYSKNEQYEEVQQALVDFISKQGSTISAAE